MHKKDTRMCVRACVRLFEEENENENETEKVNVIRVLVSYNDVSMEMS